MLFENELERKINKKPMGGSLGKFSAVLFPSARLQKRERGRVKQQLWRGRSTKKGRGWTYIESRSRKIESQTEGGMLHDLLSARVRGRK